MRWFSLQLKSQVDVDLFFRLTDWLGIRLLSFNVICFYCEFFVVFFVVYEEWYCIWCWTIYKRNMSSNEQRDVRNVAETLYRNAQRPPFVLCEYLSCFIQNNQNYSLLITRNWMLFYFHLPLARSHHTHLDLLSFVNEDYIAGYTQDGQMSTVRRFFCLFVAFDLFFISMLWFICIMVNAQL